MKKIIQRNLPLNVKYTLIDKKYIPLSEGYGCGCDNCGQLIANIATVKSENGNIYNIGFDCLETFLINNQLLDGYGIEEFEKVKKMIPKIIRFSKVLKECIDSNKQRNINVIKFEFERPSGWFTDYITYYWVFDRARRTNDCVKLKEMDFDFLLETLKNIFPKIEIIELKK